MGEFTPQTETTPNNKETVVNLFRERMLRCGKPIAYLVYGSTGRGAPKTTSDVDSMLVFPDQAEPDFIQDAFIQQLPFDGFNHKHGLFTPEDLADLQNGNIDFVRVKGVSLEETVELQMYPWKSVVKACSIFGGDSTAGGKRIDRDYQVKDPVQTRPHQNFGDIKDTIYHKYPTLTATGQRIDNQEVGIRNSNGAWSQGITFNKLLAPKILIDQIGLQDYLDRKVLRGAIRALLFYNGLYVYGEGQKIIGVKKGALDYRLIFNLLRTHKTQQGEPETYQFGEQELSVLRQRYEDQVGRLLRDSNLQIFE